MIPLSQYSGKKMGVFGLGKSGQATIAALLAGGAEVFAWDDKAESVAEAQQAHPGAVYRNFAEWPWKQIETLVLAPGVPLTHPEPHLVVPAASIHGCRIVGDIELLFEACPEATFVGITGTNGKSTTTALIAHILAQAGRRCEVGGNLGMPALGLSPLGKSEIYVLELSSYQLELLASAIFNVAVLLNITPDHLDRHGDMEGYVNAKKRIFQGQRASDAAIIGVDTKPSREVYQELKSGKNRYTWQAAGAKPLPISVKKQVSDGIYAEAGVLIDTTTKSGPDLREIESLRGEHNWQNAAAAYAACKALGLTEVEIAAGMKTFPGLAHRMKLMGKIDDVLFVNDSKATNAEATENALKAYDDIYWILGGKAKEGGIESLTNYFAKIKKAYLIGDAAKDFGALLKEKQVEHLPCGTLEKAFEEASRDALKAGKGVVLLSPACASFDQFRSFEHRGEVFGELVAKRVKLSRLEKVNEKLAAG